MRDARRPAGEDERLTLSIQGIRIQSADAEGNDGAYTGIELQAGTLTLLMGANGAGKTTFLEKLAGLREPEGLTVQYGSEALWHRSRFRRRRLNAHALLEYAYTAQTAEQALFSRTVEDELRYSLHPYGMPSGETVRRGHEEAITDALAAVGFDKTWLARDPFRMSGGQKRRTALASAFVTPAAWLLLDEPTAGLDREGHERVAEHLRRLKEQGRGIVLVSHDADWALPLADQVLLLHPGGELRSCTKESLIGHLAWMEEAEMHVPEWLRFVHDVYRTGIPLQDLWDPSKAAEAIVRLPAKAGTVSVNDTNARPKSNRSERQRFPSSTHRLTRFDARAVWLAYALLAAGLFSLSTWPGLVLGAGTVLALLVAGNVSLRRWRGVIGNFVYLAITIAAFSAIVTTGDGRLWDPEAFTGTLFPFARTLLVLLIGLGLPLVMTPLSLRRSLEQLFSWRGRTTAYWQRLILTVTLLIRFVPVLLTEWERFGRIFLARGKETGKTPRVLLRRLRGVMLPLLLALFRLGDDVVTALESRGVRKDVIPTRGSRLIWSWPDTVLVGGAVVLAGMVWFFG